MSGLKINLLKSKAIWIGHKTDFQQIPPELDSLDWTDHFTLLGIQFHKDLSQMPDLNFSEKIDEIRMLLKTWSNVSITPIEKITILKTLAWSKLMHVLYCLPSPDETWIAELQQLFLEFLWKKRDQKYLRVGLVYHTN